MKFNSLKINNFKSFGKDVSFSFLNGIGFGNITGINEVEPDLGANAAGKSTLWDALTWVLFGKSTRGVKGPNLLNWNNSGGYFVILDFEKNDIKYTLNRSWKPNKLKVNNKIYTQEELDDLIGFDYDSFLYLILMGQFNDWFFDLQPTKQLDIFTNTLNLNIWYDLSDKAHRKLKNINNLFESKKEKKYKLQGIIETSKIQLDSLLKKKEFLIDEIEEKCIKLENRIEETNDNKKKLEEEYKKFKTDNIDTGFVINGINKKLEDEEYKKKRGYHIIDKIKSERAEYLAEKNFNKNQFDKYGSLGNVCVECGQVIEKGFVAGKITEYEVIISKANNKISELNIKLEEEKKKLDVILEKIDELESVVLEKRKKAGIFQQLDRNFKKDIANYNNELSRIDDIFNVLEQKEKNIDNEIVELTNDIKNIENKYSTIEKELDELESEKEIYDYWKSEFKQIRLWIVEKVLKQLELEVNAGLSELGLIDWQIQFDIERENKSGGISKGFTVMVTPPNATEAVPWNSYSGGETQRLRIAGNIGLSNLIKSIKGIDINLEIWDEPTAHLSPEGVEDLLNFFKERSKDNELWLIDHRTLDFEFDRKITIRKTSEGSLIEEA